MNLLFNYRRCPDCGNRLKHYYYECRRCGRTDITNWPLTIMVFLIMAVVFYSLILAPFLARMNAGILKLGQ